MPRPEWRGERRRGERESCAAAAAAQANDSLVHLLIISWLMTSHQSLRTPFLLLILWSFIIPSLSLGLALGSSSGSRFPFLSPALPSLASRSPVCVVSQCASLSLSLSSGSASRSPFSRECASRCCSRSLYLTLSLPFHPPSSLFPFILLSILNDCHSIYRQLLFASFGHSLNLFAYLYLMTQRHWGSRAGGGEAACAASACRSDPRCITRAWVFGAD